MFHEEKRISSKKINDIVTEKKGYKKKLAIGKEVVSKVHTTSRDTKSQKASVLRKISTIAFKTVRNELKDACGKPNVHLPCIIPVPESGDLLPFLSTFLDYLQLVF